MKAFDAEDISTSVDKVVELCQQLEESKDYDTALHALAALSCMKLIVGEDKFDGLPAFSRWLALANDIVKKNEKKGIAQKKRDCCETNKSRKQAKSSSSLDLITFYFILSY